MEKRQESSEALNNSRNTYSAVFNPAENFVNDANLANQALIARTPAELSTRKIRLLLQMVLV
ncbi:hypothetical protein BU25DRAFT_33699 [Macroventuria anomochaeta]|uniref:Uncharacterized protein n=1 Tax=Macroventuria anomochaeta TaxID=301207 RepID=A0ACB6S232_9PLEO|nr:uncharacterized protein BU25DRAFT_33699 [Macroventuria anomochaeta]KAF2628340.1 hypothetical protein BU25DRAFT_33699 [Macroventuria anomochaeta]